MKFSHSEKPELSWDDFIGIVPPGARYMASTNSGLDFSFKVKGTGRDKKFIYNVDSYFYPESSWKKREAAQNIYLLKHEQLHWDITELSRRKIVNALHNYKPRSSYKNDLSKIFKLGEKKRKQLQEQFDRETNHGQNTRQQTIWEARIAEELFRTSGL